MMMMEKGDFLLFIQAVSDNSRRLSEQLNQKRLLNACLARTISNPSLIRAADTNGSSTCLPISCMGNNGKLDSARAAARAER